MHYYIEICPFKEYNNKKVFAQERIVNNIIMKIVCCSTFNVNGICKVPYFWDVENAFIPSQSYNLLCGNEGRKSYNSVSIQIELCSYS